MIGKGRSRRPVAGSPPFYRVDLSSYSSWRVVGERRRTVLARGSPSLRRLTSILRADARIAN